MDRALHKTVAHQDLQNIFNYNQIAPMPQPQEGSEKEPSFFYSL